MKLADQADPVADADEMGAREGMVDVVAADSHLAGSGHRERPIENTYKDKHFTGFGTGGALPGSSVVSYAESFPGLMSRTRRVAALTSFYKQPLTLVVYTGI